LVGFSFGLQCGSFSFSGKQVEVSPVLTNKFADNVAFIVGCLTIRPMTRDEILVRTRLNERAAKNPLAYLTQMGYAVLSSENPARYILTEDGINWLEDYKKSFLLRGVAQELRPDLTAKKQAEIEGLRGSSRVFTVMRPNRFYTVKDLTELTNLTRNGVIGALNRLKHKGFVRRSDSADNRQTSYWTRT